MKLVEDWKEAHTWLSVHIATIMAMLNAAQASIPYVQNLLTPTQMAVINAILGIAVIWGRLIQQGRPQ